MAITAVGSLAVSNASYTLAVSPTAVGDILVLSVLALADLADNPSAVSGGGVTTWNHIIGYVGGTGVPTADLWWGVVTSTGAANITITDATSTTVLTMACQQFTGGAGTWAADGTGGDAGSATLTTGGNYPSLTPAGTNELYVGCLMPASGSPGGSTSGFTYSNPIGSTGNEAKGAFVYNPSTSAPTAQSPAWTSANGRWASAAGLLTFTPTNILVAPVIKTQAVQRASVW